MIVLKGVSKTFGKLKVLSNVSFRIDPGELVCVTGKSGAGKSTLLHLLTGAEEVSVGGIEVDGVDLRTVPAPVMQLYRRRIGVVFQDYKLLPNRTVAENIAFPLEVCGVPDEEIEQRVTVLLKQLDLLKHANTLPKALSGGEKARTAIARAIVHQPIILLADEPTGNLDPEQSMAILDIFRKINKEGTTVIVASHDTGLVDDLQGRVIRLEEGGVVRDSVGGYMRAKRGKHVDPQPGKHKIFPDENVISAAPEIEPEKSAAPRRKVKITSIGG